MVGERRESHSVDISEKWQTEHDDLSIVASDEEGSSAEGSSGVSTDQQSKRPAPVDLVRRETQAVSYLRYLILVLLLLGIILLSYGTYTWVSQADGNAAGGGSSSSSSNSGSSSSTGGSSSSGVCSLEELQDHFVENMEENLQQDTANLLSSAFTLSAAATSYVLDLQRLTWPMVTIPDFEPRLTGVLQTTGTTQIVMSPFVEATERTDFEAYAVEQQESECSTCPVVSEIYNANDAPIGETDLTSPMWQIAPFTSEPWQLQNLLSDVVQGEALERMMTLSAAVWADFPPNMSEQLAEFPNAILFFPIYDDFQQVDLVASVSFEVPWETILSSAVPYQVDFDTDLLLESICTTPQAARFTLEAGTKTVVFASIIPQIPATLQQESLLITLPGAYTYGEFQEGIANDVLGACGFRLWVVPSDTVDELVVATTTTTTNSPAQAEKDDDDEDADNKNRAPTMTAVVAAYFLVLLGVFLAYDWLVEKRQSVVVNIATKSSAIVENLFPAQVRDRMLENMARNKPDKNGGDPMNGGNGGDGNGGIPQMMPDGQMSNAKGNQPEQANPGTVSVKQFLTAGGTGADFSSQPIADLFPNTTVLFADIAGFTAWSSQRDPPQVFTLLETLYRSFDVIASKLKVFKVETIGDCYMAVTGLPNPDDAHAVHMSRFAYQCLIGMKELIRELEAILGPGTSDLALRVGLHSGAVTAGVLRGEKSRFQLFGDTVNTASRMESTSARGRIQVSQETADLLMGAGKSHWLKPRDELVVAKGKGELKTYWLDPTKKKRNTKNHKDIKVQADIALNANGQGGVPVSPGAGEVPFDDKYARLIDWNVDVLLHHLARVISCRSRSPSRGSLVNHSSEVSLLPAAINDVAEVIALPPFDPDASRFRRARPDVSMLQQTREDLHEYVKRIALMYRDVPFHNFEHASHVTLCANKLLNRLINSDEYDSEEELHNATFGISSDPLTHFAIVFAALIHDADHTGLPNAQLVKDKHEVAVKFDNNSVAEQNSVHMGWEMLMDPRFERLRKCIYQTNVERKRFRQLVINSVMATDIADRKVNEARQLKWDRAFRKNAASDATMLQQQEDMNRKATAVIEHIIQVSDVAHTMQHWHIYRRWNERLFHEMHDAYQTGKVAVDPSTNWYVGELGFFDYYLIPLAMKLKECGVFGASGYEYISYVLKNKKEWERKGRQVVSEMVLLYKDVEDEDDHSGSSFDSEEDYDSDDLEYDSPGDMSDSDEEDDASRDVDSMDPAEIP